MYLGYITTGAIAAVLGLVYMYLDYLVKNPVFLTVVNTIIPLVVGAFVAAYANWKVKQAEKEIAYKYMLLETKIKNLQEIYPKLYTLMLEAASIFAIFDTINNRIIRHQEEKGAIEDKELLSSIDDLFPNIEVIIKDYGAFNNYYVSYAGLFISHNVEKCVQEIINIINKLLSIVKNEMYSKRYLAYTHDERLQMIATGKSLLEALSEKRDYLKCTINKELNPY